MPTDTANWIGLELGAGRYVIQKKLGDGGLLAWFCRVRPHRQDAGSLVFLWPLIDGILGGFGGWVGLQIGFWVGGPMGYVYALAVLAGVAGIFFGLVSGNNWFTGPVAGAVLAVSLGELLALAGLLLDRTANYRIYLTVMGAVIGVAWTLGVTAMVRLPVFALVGSGLLVAIALGVLLRFVVIRERGEWTYHDDTGRGNLQLI